MITTGGQQKQGVDVQFDAGSLRTARARASVGGRSSKGFEYLFSQTIARSGGQERLYFPAFDSADTNGGIAEHMDRDMYQSGFAKVSRSGFSGSAGWVSRSKRVPTASYETLFGDPRFETTDGRFFAHAQYGRMLNPRTEIVGRVFVDASRYHGVYPYAGETPGDTYVQDDQAKGNGWGGEVMATRRLPRGHAATIGLEFRDDFTLDQSYWYTNDDPGLDSRHALVSWGLSAQDEFPLGENVLVNAGARVDHYESFGTTANPRLGVILGPSRPTTIKLLYGRAFRAPNPYELFYWPSQGSLRPEVISTSEVVWEQRIGGRITTSVAGYRNSVSDLIRQTIGVPVGSMSPIVFENLSHVLSRGVDLGLDARWPSGIEVRLGYTYVDADFRETGVELSNSPWNLAKVAAILPLGMAGATAALEGE